MKITKVGPLMNDENQYKSIEIIVGFLIVLITLMLLFFGIFNFLSEKTNNYNKYLAEFSASDGIIICSDVRLAGVKIGSVSNLNLNKETYLATVEISVDKTIKIPEDTEANISSDGLLGEKYVSLNVGGSDVMLDNGEKLIYTQGSIDFLNLILKFANEIKK